MKRFHYLLVFMFLLYANIALPQQPDFSVKEKLLAERCKSIWRQQSDSAKLAVNQLFLQEYVTVLKEAGAFRFPFDSLTLISRLKPNDASFRITTWNIPLSDGSFKYYGVLEWMGTNRVQHIKIIENRASSSEYPPQSRITAANWYGALYYQVIQQKYSGSNSYILLGWNGKDRTSNLKMIDAITFEGDEVWFGSPIFKTKEGIKNRVLFEYAKKAAFVMKYDRQIVMVTKGNSVKPRKESMIVLDRLVPANPSFEDDFRYYVPSGDTHDAFVFRKGYWVFAEDVIAFNPQPTKGKSRSRSSNFK